MVTVNAAEHVGEVIESSTSYFTAQASELNGAPGFGTFVKTTTDPVSFGLVYDIRTQSVDANRKPTAYGMTEEELRREQPQIFELLRTEFDAVIVGHQGDRGPLQILPLQPPGIHTFCYACDDREVKALTGNGDFVRSILAGTQLPTDELIIASVRTAWAVRGYDMAYLVTLGKELSRLIRDDYERLSSLIRRISQ
ncbi:TPA: hypothetical protein DCE37_04195 [Candidatus Latescibacteria bacterium]|nr:hypothetical protein [Candidatus Latescibacterota bacterium]|tara:strand:+ start:1071 stop:1658 length:588 start_codon:yes stop_codon:yes gene_type:complete